MNSIHRMLEVIRQAQERLNNIGITEPTDAELAYMCKLIIDGPEIILKNFPLSVEFSSTSAGAPLGAPSTEVNRGK